MPSQFKTAGRYPRSEEDKNALFKEVNSHQPLGLIVPFYPIVEGAALVAVPIVFVLPVGRAPRYDCFVLADMVYGSA